MHDTAAEAAVKDFPKHPLLVLAVLGLLFFADLVLHPDQVLYADHSDLLTLHLPSKVLLVRSWQETGELPLWDPYSFSGLPFIHDTQVSAFYPAHLPLYLLPVEQVGAALGWIILVHVIGAGWCMYAYARTQGMERGYAFIAALGYMFAGKWLIHVLHVGHYNMLPLAWLPLLLLFQDQAIRRGSFVRATLAGAVFALFILCAYPYVTLYTGLFVALWTFGAVWFPADVTGEERAGLRSTVKLAWWLGGGVWLVVVGVALGAVQLLPSLEAAPHTTRSLGVEASSNMLFSGIQSVVTLTGRGVVGSKNPDGEFVEPSVWEYEGGIGVIWLALAVIGVAELRGKHRFHAAVAGLVLAFGLGGGMLLQGLPGFRLFRLPSRMLLLLPLPLTLLAASALQRLLSETSAERESPGESSPAVDRHSGSTPGARPFLLLKVLLGVAILQGMFTLLRGLQGDPLYPHIYWLVLPFTALAAFWLLKQSARPGLLPIWFLVLLLDLWTLTGQLVTVKPWADIFTPSKCVRDVLERTHGEPGVGRIMARNPPGTYSTRLPLWSGLPEIWQLESIGGFNPTDVRRYKEYLQFITDVDKPLQPPNGDFTMPVLESFPVKNESLLHLLGVRYLIQPQWQGVPAHLKGERPVDETHQRLIGVDPAPHCFDLAAGLVTLPPYAVYEYQQALPRVFVVPEADSLYREPRVLDVLKTTDFRRTVLLEDFHADNKRDTAGPRAAVIKEYLPNRIVVEVGDGEAAYLVLTDIWFPGWHCVIDGDREATVHRANYVFRAVDLPAGPHELVFTFAPRSYELGKTISTAALLGLVAILLGSGVHRLRSGSRHSDL